MALFGRKEKEGAEKTAQEPAARRPAAPRGGKKVSAHAAPDVLLKPRITERATELVERGVYVFEVRPEANKQEVAKAVRALYKVSPEKVNIVNQKGKRTFSRGRAGRKRDMKKAYVYLKAGERIEIV